MKVDKKNFFSNAKIASGGGLSKLNKPRYYKVNILLSAFRNRGVL